MSDFQAAKLTAREYEIVALVARGMSAKEVALQLCIAPSTVERHVENVRLKTRTRNRVHMVAHVIRLGLIEPPGTIEWTMEIDTQASQAKI